MNKYWLYLEPYSFIFEGIQGAIIYNTLNASILMIENENEIMGIIKQLKSPSSGYCVEISEKTLENKVFYDFVNKLRNTFTGDVIDQTLSDDKPFIMKPILNLLHDPEKSENIKGYTLKENLLHYIHEVTIHLEITCNSECSFCKDFHKQCVFCTENIDGKILEINDYSALFNRLNIIGVRRVNLIFGKVDYDIYSDLIQLSKNCNFQIYIYIHYSNISDEYVDFLNGKNIVLVILLDNLVKKESLLKLVNLNFGFRAEYIYLVTSEKDIEISIELAEEFGLDFTTIPFYTKKNDTFFEDYVFLNLDDIESETVSKRQIFARQTLNEILFGKITIMQNGDVFANVNKSLLGNIKKASLNEFIYKEFASKESWLMKRDKSPCLECVYRYICPSPGNYEIVLRRFNLCHIYNNIIK